MRKILSPRSLLCLFVLASLLAVVAAPIASAEPTSSVETSPIKNSAYFLSGSFRSYVIVKTPERLFVTISMVVDASASGQGWFDVEGCTSALYTPCGDVSRVHSFAYVAGWNRVRWRLTFVTSAPINTFAASVFDSVNEGSASSFTSNQLIG